MFKSIWSKLLLIIIFQFAVTLPCYGGVIFEDNFDAQPNWNTNNQYEGVESLPEDPAAPPNWSFFRDVPGAPGVGFSPVISINTLPDGTADHTGHSGKAIVKYVESYPAANYPGDGILGKYWPTANYNELYVRFWLKTQAGWQTAPGSVSKIFRVFHFDGGTGANIFNFFPSGNSAPIYLYELATSSGSASSPNKAEYISLYRADPQETDYYLPSSAPWYEQNDYYFGWNGSVGSSLSSTTWTPWVNTTDSGIYADTQWHRYDFHLKVNDIGSSNGIMEFSYDGVLKESHNDVVWKMSGSSASIGWNAVGFGGNSDNPYSSQAEEWYAIDDIVVSTTPIPDGYVIGGGTTTDTTPPTVSISSPAGGASVNGTASVTATASDNVGVTKVEFYVNGTLQGTDTATPYLFNWNTTTVANGTYTLTAKAYDAAGNVGQSSAVSVTVNNVAAGTTPPPTVAITSPANGTTVSGAVAVSASASDSLGISKVEFYDNGTLSAAVNASPYSFNWNTASAASGSHTLTAKAYDPAGNVGQSSPVAVTVSNTVAAGDTTPPTVAITSPANGASVSGTVNVSATANDNVGVTKVELYVNGVLNSTNTTSNPYMYAWNTAGLASGSYTLTTKAYDAAGNVGQSSAVTVKVSNTVADTTAPTVAITSPANSASVSGTVSVSTTASDNVGVTKVELYVNGALQGTVTASPYNFSWNTTSLTSGSYTLTAKAYDAAGNVGQSSAVTVKVSNTVAVGDTTPPTVAITSPANGASVSGTVNVSATANDNVGVTKVELYVNGVLNSTNTTSNPYMYAWNTAGLASGSYTLTTKAYDAAGNVGQSSAVTVKVSNTVAGGDTTPPTVAITSPANGASVSGTVNVSATANDNVGVTKVELYVNGVLNSTNTTSNPYMYAWDTTGLASGSYTLTTKAYDAAGNVGQSSAVTVKVGNSVADTTPPTVTINSPANYARVSGTITINASAADNVGVTQMKLYIDNVLKATTTGSPLNWSWNTSTYASGYHHIKVQAYDAANNVGTKTITVRK